MNSSRIVATLDRITSNPRWLAFMARQTPKRQASIRESNAVLLRCVQSSATSATLPWFQQPSTVADTRRALASHSPRAA